MLSKFSIKNIKSYQNEAEVSIKPLTLLYGLNSSGKSTLWKFLATIRISTGAMVGMGRSRSDFLNLGSRLYNFADRKTLSFDNSNPSSFSFTFANGDGDESKVNFKYSFENQLSEINVGETAVALEAAKILRDRIESKVENEKDKKIAEDFSMMVKEFQRLNESIEKANVTSRPDSLKLNSFEIYYNKKLFIKYAIEELPILPRVFPGAGPGSGRAISNDLRIKFNHGVIDKVWELFDQYCPNKFKRNYQINLKKEDWIEELQGPFKDGAKKIFDFMSPTGPLDIKSSKVPRFLFIPTFISEENLFWEEHFNFLQFLKKRIKSLNTKGNLDEVYPRYWGNSQYYEDEYLRQQGIDPLEIQEVKSINSESLKVMKADNIDDFKKVMINNFKTHILKGNSFIPNGSFTGGEVNKQIFDWMLSSFQRGTWEDIDNSNDNDLKDWAYEFAKVYGNFQKYSIFYNLTKLGEFGKELRSNMDAPSSLDGAGGPSRIHHTLNYDWPERFKADKDFKKKILDILERIDMPFDIQTREDDSKNLKLVFENKNIKKIGDKQIPLSESGNALSSIIGLIEKIINVDSKIIIIEEPENKLHPKIQGHVIELLYEIAKNNNNKLIIETHSEHFILRLQKLVRDKKASPKDISINYISLAEDGSGSRVDNMEINDKGDFKNKWRHGFFNERLDEI